MIKKIMDVEEDAEMKHVEHVVLVEKTVNAQRKKTAAVAKQLSLLY